LHRVPVQTDIPNGTRKAVRIFIWTDTMFRVQAIPLSRVLDYREMVKENSGIIIDAVSQLCEFTFLQDK